MPTTIREQIYCEHCDAKVLYDVVLKKETYKPKGVKVEITSRVARCKSCKTELFHPALDKDNQHRAFDKYREKTGEDLNYQNAKKLHDMREEREND